MGTSKGYITPTKPEWSAAKRAISTYLRNRDTESRTNAVSKYAKAVLAGGTNSIDSSSSVSIAVGRIIAFTRGVAGNGLDSTLRQFGREDLIGKPPETIINELVDEFTNHSSTVDDSLALAAISTAFEVLKVNSPEDLADINLNAFLVEMIIAYVNNDFDFKFYEKISQGRTPETTHGILTDIHGYIDGTLRLTLKSIDIYSVDLKRMSANEFVADMLNDAYNVFISINGVEKK